MVGEKEVRYGRGHVERKDVQEIGRDREREREGRAEASEEGGGRGTKWRRAMKADRDINRLMNRNRSE